MDINGASTEVIEYQVLFNFADAANGALQHFFYEDTLLGVHDLIVTFLEFSVNLDVLDVKHSIVRESFLKSPQITVLLTHKGKSQKAW